ncbi:MAG TPA: DNA polymerase/3'-5' exonuclease PolX [Candidatus Baltobacteraceae bacterium]|nr:DNA polymerase/3'-5' exonuclease PolX [Candidatus Baltobacteraceae bacterium]
MTKDKIAEILTDIATLLDLKGENPFKSRAYINAARAIETATEPLEKIFAADSTMRLKGVGDSIHEKICEMLQTGGLAYYEELKNSVPPGLIALLNIPGLGPQKVKALHDKLGVETVEQLEKACLEGKVATLDRFGEKTQVKISQGINFRRQYASRHLLSDALLAAEPILENLRAHPDVTRCSTAGSLRRFKEIIGDVDFLVSSRNPAAVIDAFTQQAGVISVSAKGETKASVVLTGGIQADLRVVADAEFPFALAYFTGSKEHNIVMRQRAIQRGLRLNEYGLFRSAAETRDPQLLVPCSTEEEIFQELGLAYVPPELREDAGEFASAEKHAFPRLVEWTHLKGSLHNHSNWSDGRDSLEEIARFMHDLGCSYWAITDHSKSSFQAHGLQPARLREQLREIQALNRKLAGEGDGFELLTGAEVDILAGGQLDFDDDLLAELDVVVASIHQSFTQSESETTKRLIAAAENPFVHMLGHLTGRLLLEREPYKVNQNAVIEACAATGTWIELNANPLRFDMDWRLWHQARDKGVKCVINCDAHKTEHAQFLRLGAGIARKGWLEAKDVINTLPLDKLKKELQRKRGR